MPGSCCSRGPPAPRPCQPTILAISCRRSCTRGTTGSVKAAQYYAKDPDLVFYNDSPLEYTGWDAYAAGVRKEFAGYKSFATTLANDVSVHRVGDSFAWGTATWRADAVKRDGSTETVYGQWTVLFEKRAGKWLIIHEHVSVPVPEN